MDTFVVSVCPLAPDSSDFGDVCALYAPFLHQLTMQSSLFERGCPTLVVVCVARKLCPCSSYSRRRDRISLGLWRSLYKGGVGYTSCMRSSVCAPTRFAVVCCTILHWAPCCVQRCLARCSARRPGVRKTMWCTRLRKGAKADYRSGRCATGEARGLRVRGWR